MSHIYNHDSRYVDILNRLHKHSSQKNIFFFIIRQNVTTNIAFYFLCVIFRFIHLIIISGDYINAFSDHINYYSFQNQLKVFTCHNILKYLNVSYNIYILICIILFILLCVRIFIYIYSITLIRNYNKYSNKAPLKSKYLIISEHAFFLFFPFIIEYLSFAYYIYFFNDKFFIRLKATQVIALYPNMVFNTILIVMYNINNFLFILSYNKFLSANSIEAYLKINSGKKIKRKKPIQYKISKLNFYILIFLQNFSLISFVNKYLNNNDKVIYKIIISLILFSSIFLLFFKKLHDYNYKNSINTSINVLLLFCGSSIIIDCLMYLTKYEIKSKLHEIIYVIIKFILSYLIYLLLSLKSQKFLESKIPEIMFEKNEEKKKYFVNCFSYLHQLMIRIKDNKDINSIYLIVEILSKHLNKCNNNFCSCKLLESYIKKEKFNYEDFEKIKSYIGELLIILNHLFECAFIGYDYYANCELTILLAEHFCHLRNNPTISFSLVSSLIINQKSKIRSYHMSILYDLNQKYIYYIYAMEKKEIEEEIKSSNKELLMNEEKRIYFKNYFFNLKMSSKINKFMNLYIDNRVKILKYKNVFEESVKINFDESNEYITSVKINFFDINSQVEGILEKKEEKENIKGARKLNKRYEKSSNLYKIINLLNHEKLNHKNILKLIKVFKEVNNIPFFMVFKFYLFFDIFEGGKFPSDISIKMQEFITNKKVIYNGIITANDFSKLRALYNYQNNKINSKYFAIYEYKNDLRTKYFSEDCSLKLGYKQKNIINKKIDILMPKEFYKSHQNLIKYLLIGGQIKNFHTNNSFLFDSSSTVLYSINFDSVLLYSISKYLSIITEMSFFIENDYKFMLNSNFDLLANSKNFEDEYYLNQTIFQKYGIKILDILKIKPEKFTKKFKKTIQRIHNEKLIRQAKTEEYFIPQFYMPYEEQLNNMVKSNYFNSSKNKILLKILDLSEKIDNNIEPKNTENDEEKKFINKKSINDVFINTSQIIFYDTYNIILSKKIFIENIAKELTKIQDNDLVFDIDKNKMNNLIIAGKQQINDLLTKSELSNHYLKVVVKLSYYYDKSFYFISIDDEKKLYLNISNELHFENNTTYINDFDNRKKSRNKKNISSFKSVLKESSKHKVSFDEQNSKNILTTNKSDLYNYSNDDEKNNIINKIDKYRNQINKNNFNVIIKIILFTIIICLFIFCFLIISLQTKLIKVIHLILISHNYNLNTRQMMYNIYSKLLETYFSFRGIFTNTLTSLPEDYSFLYKKLCRDIKENNHNFIESYIDYSLLVGNDFNHIYKQRVFFRIEGFWEEISYNSTYAAEIESIAYNLYTINYSDFFNDDLYYFTFFQNQTSTHIKVQTTFIKTLYYFCVNYEFVYKDLFIEIENSLYSSFNKFIEETMSLDLILELLGIIFYLLFLLAVIIYLNYSNHIIIKNIIFLFMDFSEEKYDKINGSNNNNMIIWKLLEFKVLLDDFDLNKLDKYSKNLDKLNKNKNRTKLVLISNKNLSSILSSDIDSGILVEKKIDGTNVHSNQSIRNSINNTNTNRKNFESKKFSKNDLSYKNMNVNSISNDPDLTKRFFDNKNKKNMNNSSHDILMDNSNFLKDKLNNNNAFNENNDILDIDKINSNNNPNQIISNANNDSYKGTPIKKHKDKDKNIPKDVNELNENIQDIIINKSNNNKIFVIKIYSIIIAFVILAILVFSTYKIKITYSFKSSLNGYYIDYNTLVNRYSLLFYYFNLIRTLLVFPKGERKEHMENIANLMRSEYEQENQKFFDLVTYYQDKYEETSKLFEIFNYKNNASSFLINSICDNGEYCVNYLKSSNGYFDSGIDFIYKTFFNQINNIYMDYTKLNDKTSLYEIQFRIIRVFFNQWGYINHGINIIFIEAQRLIFEKFTLDQKSFKDSFNRNITVLNLVSITISILAFLFVNIVIFLTISNYTEPIKDSIYRINCSFYYIKKYNFNYFRHCDGFHSI